jgi:hypothetical protein
MNIHNSENSTKPVLPRYTERDSKIGFGRAGIPAKTNF